MMINVVKRYIDKAILLELSPSAVFLVFNFIFNFWAATAASMASAAICVFLSYHLTGKLPALALLILTIVLTLGAIGLYSGNETFIKIRPTIGKCIFALGLGIGLFFRPSILHRFLSNQLSITDRGWTVLTLSWIGFALFSAAINELVWRLFSTNAWVWFTSIDDVAAIACYALITHIVARKYWRT